MAQTNILLEVGTNELEIVEFILNEADYSGHYGVNVAKVVEIIRMQEITNLPQSINPAIMGGFSHRGSQVIPLVNLGAFLGKEIKPTAESKIIITEFNGVHTGFMVSAVTRIHRFSWTAVEAPGKFLQGLSKNTVTGVVRLEERVVFLLDMEHIVGIMQPTISIFMRDDLPKLSTLSEGRKYSILHADDSASVRKLVHQLLGETGRFNMVQVSDGLEAWETLQKLKERSIVEGKSIKYYIQGVITDIEMPQLDGLTLCKRIKEDEVLKMLPVALFSSLISDKLEHKGMTVGADAQFAKPDLYSLGKKVLEMLDANN